MNAKDRYIFNLKETLNHIKHLFYFFLFLVVVSSFAEYILVKNALTDVVWWFLAAPETVGVALSYYLCSHWALEMISLSRTIKDIQNGIKPVPVWYYWEDGSFKRSDEI
jgi:hypothetical protein